LDERQPVSQVSGLLGRLAFLVATDSCDAESSPVPHWPVIGVVIELEMQRHSSRRLAAAAAAVASIGSALSTSPDINDTDRGPTAARQTRDIHAAP